MARSLGMNIGYYYHNVGSLHYYEVGGSDGERPPTVEHPAKERWLSALGADMVFIPVPPENCSLVKVMGNARQMMKELEHHLDRGGKASQFIYECKDHELRDYFAHWLDFIHWSWKEYV